MSCPGNSWAFVAGATVPISRSDDESMPAHRRGGATKKAVPSYRNPPGGRGLRPVSASLVVADATASTPPRSLTPTRKPRPQMPSYFLDRTLELHQFHQLVV